MPVNKLQRKAKGERPYFFQDPNVDKVIAMVMGLAGEVAVLHDRLDTVERLLKKKSGIKRGDVDGYKPSAKVMEERAAWRERFLAEVLRIVEIENEALASGDLGTYDDAVTLVEADRTARKRRRAAATPDS